MRRFSLLIAAALALAPAIHAHEHAPRVLSPHNADAYSMKTFAEFPRWRDLRAPLDAYLARLKKSGELKRILDRNGVQAEKKSPPPKTPKKP